MIAAIEPIAPVSPFPIQVVAARQSCRFETRPQAAGTLPDTAFDD
jgi:hypothetical protein